MVLTSHDQLGNTGTKTGFWLEEFAAPYYVFKDAGVAITLASPLGGQPPLDPKSDDPDAQTEATHRFKEATTILTPGGFWVRFKATGCLRLSVRIITLGVKRWLPAEW